LVKAGDFELTTADLREEAQVILKSNCPRANGQSIMPVVNINYVQRPAFLVLLKCAYL